MQNLSDEYQDISFFKSHSGFQQFIYADPSDGAIQCSLYSQRPGLEPFILFSIDLQDLSDEY